MSGPAFVVRWHSALGARLCRTRVHSALSTSRELAACSPAAGTVDTDHRDDPVGADPNGAFVSAVPWAQVPSPGREAGYLAFGERNICERSSEWTHVSSHQRVPRALGRRRGVVLHHLVLREPGDGAGHTARASNVRTASSSTECRSPGAPSNRARLTAQSIFAQIKEASRSGPCSRDPPAWTTLADDRLEALLEAKFDQPREPLAAIWMPAPKSFSSAACSNTVTSTPRWSSASAAVRTPMPGARGQDMGVFRFTLPPSFNSTCSWPDPCGNFIRIVIAFVNAQKSAIGREPRRDAHQRRPRRCIGSGSSGWPSSNLRRLRNLDMVRSGVATAP